MSCKVCEEPLFQCRSEPPEGRSGPGDVLPRVRRGGPSRNLDGTCVGPGDRLQERGLRGPVSLEECTT